MSRAELWRTADVPLHLSMVDAALDENDAAHVAIRDEASKGLARVEAKMQVGFEKCSSENDALRRLLVSLLVAVLTTSLGIIATIVVTAAT